MTEQNSQNNQIIPLNIETISFDSFERNRYQDIVCVAPIRTTVRREEEIVLIRRVRKVEEIDASQACPVNTLQILRGQLQVNAQEQHNLPSLTNESDKKVAIKITVTGQWNYGIPTTNAPTANYEVTADGNQKADRTPMLYKEIPPAALVMVKKDGEPMRYGTKQSIDLNSKETIAFINNDQPGTPYNDNSGTLKVTWEIDGDQNIDLSSIRIKTGEITVDINDWTKKWSNKKVENT